MRRALRTRALLTVETTIAASVCAGGVADAASSGKLPKLFLGNGGSKSAIRPPSVQASTSANGGELEVHLTSWGATGAVGQGTEHPDNGDFPIKVHAFRPVRGEFTRLTVRVNFGSSGGVRIEQLMPAYIGGDVIGWWEVDRVRTDGEKPWAS